MYYAEKLIDGVWHYKTLPSQDWKLMSVTMLNEKVTNLKWELQNIRKQKEKTNE